MESISEAQQATNDSKLEEFDNADLTKEGVTDLDDEYLTEEERLHPWRQTRAFYWSVVVASVAVLFYGIDITAISGAQVGYIPHFGIGNRTYLQGVLVSCIYFGCFVGVFIALFTNTYFGRRFTICLAAVFSTGACIWEAVSPSWQVFIPGRIILGFSYGMIGETAPVYLAEMSPASIRGAIVSLYQQVITIGIFLAYLCNLIFVWVNYKNVGWRIMIGFPMVPSVVEIFLIWTVPESPRWLIKKGRYEEAKRNLYKLRLTAETAERDFVRIKKGVEEDELLQKGKNLLVEVIRVPYIRRAVLVGCMEMLFQQMSGMNVFMNYIDEVFKENIHMGSRVSVAVSLFPGFVNMVATVIVYFTIDRYGRRTLQLVTFPIMFLMLLMVLFSFYGDKKVNLAFFIIGVIFFIIAYSPGAGPVPWTFCAEVFPTYVRAAGTTITTFAVNAFDFALSFSWPSMKKAWGPQGGFGFYAGFNFLGIVMQFLFLPETKGFTLEQMRVVFEEGLFTIAWYHCRAGWRSLRKLLGLSVPDTPLVSPYDKAFALDRARREEAMLHAGEAAK
ncbi:hypothetical protein GpartN1_g5352.t1 [Galdieria partita]|uniref:Major facilitator superfamily (MFS) profile domain-containing protein n=1 Tax=Galdieria partita TaxID=83374 RepID=A0A9C7Q0Z2_9RHOD|nr:hypothetical protein GpartN1_g5352.t1 [Galdieria partita]